MTDKYVFIVLRMRKDNTEWTTVSAVFKTMKEVTEEVERLDEKDTYKEYGHYFEKRKVR